MDVDTRSRAHTTWLAVAAALFVALMGAGCVGGSNRDDDTPGTVPEQHETTETPGSSGTTGTTGTISDSLRDEPDGRWVGRGHAAVLVPSEWKTNDTRCGTPQSDTVVVDVGATCMALVPRPSGVESITLWESPDLESKPDAAREVTVNGVEATAWDATCEPLEQFVAPGSRSPAPEEICTAFLWVETDSVQFVAQAATAERAEELLSTVRSDPRLSALPGPNAFWLREQDRDPEADDKQFGARYVRSLRGLGFEVDVVREVGDMDGWVIGTDPEPGTMVKPGTQVTVTIGD